MSPATVIKSLGKLQEELDEANKQGDKVKVRTIMNDIQYARALKESDAQKKTQEQPVEEKEKEEPKEVKAGSTFTVTKISVLNKETGEVKTIENVNLTLGNGEIADRQVYRKVRMAMKGFYNELFAGKKVEMWFN